MAVYSITQIASTAEQAEGAVMAILADIASIPGVGEPDIVTESDGKFYLTKAIIVIPDDVKLDDVDREKLERYTNLDEKSEELEVDFGEAENEPDDPIIAASLISQDIEDRSPDIPSPDKVSAVDEAQTRNQDAEGDIQVAENDIGDLVPDPAPEMQEETVLAAGVSDKAENEKERDKVYAQKADDQKVVQEKHNSDKMNDEKKLKSKQDNEPELA